MTKILAIFLGFSAAAIGASSDPQFLKITGPGIALVSHPPQVTWKEGEFLCVFHGDKASACGVVSKSEPAGAFVRLDFSDSSALEMGDRVAKPRTGKEVSPASLVETNNVWLVPYSPPNNLFKSAFGVDIDQFYSSLSYDHCFNSHVSYGARFEIYDVLNVNKALDGYGVLFTRTFTTLPHFSGVAAQLGVGPYFFNNSWSPSNVATTFIVEANVSWRFSLTSWLKMGVQFGVRWITRPNSGNVDMGSKYHPVRGALGTDLSIRF